MSSYNANGITSLNNDTSDDNEKVRKPLLNHGSPNNNKTISSAGSPVTFTGISGEEDKFILDQTKSAEPAKDHYNVIYIVFLLFGVATLLPWNVFITAEDYFVKYKLNTNASRNASYATNFTLIVGSIGQFTNVIMNIFNILVTFGGNPKNRIPYTILLSAACIFFHIVLAIIDSEAWPLTFFILCCVSVFIMYIATGILNSCVYCVASIFPMEYVNAVILGNNLSGCFTAAMSIISKLTTPDLRTAAIYYFLSAFVALILSFIGYVAMHRMDFYIYWSKIKADSIKKQAIDNNNVHQSVPYAKIIKKIWFLLFCIWLNFFSTLSIFPVYNLGVKPNTEGFLGHWFQDIVTFLTFNILVTIGNLIPKLFKWPGPKWLPAAVILRAIIVQIFFLFSNYKPDERTLPVLITNDYVYWAGAALSPLLFGYFTSLLMMYTPQQVEPEYAGTAAMLGALCLVIGVVSGLQFSVILGLLTTI
jgi:equilibrative nucleoside transporter 1/2/3